MGLSDWLLQPAAQDIKKLRAVVSNWRDSRKARRHTAEHGVSQRMYASARASRLTNGWTVANTSADNELVTSLTALRARSRSLVRDTPYAKHARTIVQSNVIGPGIGMQPRVMTTRNTLAVAVNDEVTKVWEEWGKADSCHTGGALAFPMFERQLMGQIFEAGDVFVRMHFRAFGKSKVPFSLELIEGERLADEHYSAQLSATTNTSIRMGVEVDEFFRPVAYWVRKRVPGESAFISDVHGVAERIPADQIVHLRIIDRWPQTRGAPWMHGTARTMNDMRGLSEAEITKARVQALTVGAITTPLGVNSLGKPQPDGSAEMELQAGTFQRLNPGETITFGSPTSPNSVLPEFMRSMIREIAAGLGISYEILSGDYSQSNYSSSRMGLLEARDIWRYLQIWFITDFRKIVYSRWLQQAVYSGALKTIPIGAYALDPCKYECARYKPRGWTWVDPTKEIAAFKEAVKAGFMTNTQVIANTADGQDVEDVVTERESELELFKEHGLVFDTSPEMYAAPKPAPAAAAPAADNPAPADQPPADETTPARAGPIALVRGLSTP